MDSIVDDVYNLILAKLNYRERSVLRMSSHLTKSKDQANLEEDYIKENPRLISRNSFINTCASGNLLLAKAIYTKLGTYKDKRLAVLLAAMIASAKNDRTSVVKWLYSNRNEAFDNLLKSYPDPSVQELLITLCYNGQIEIFQEICEKIGKTKIYGIASCFIASASNSHYILAEWLESEYPERVRHYSLLKKIVEISLPKSNGVDTLKWITGRYPEFITELMAEFQADNYVGLVRCKPETFTHLDNLIMSRYPDMHSEITKKYLRTAYEKTLKSKDMSIFRILFGKMYPGLGTGITPPTIMPRIWENLMQAFTVEANPIALFLAEVYKQGLTSQQLISTTHDNLTATEYNAVILMYTRGYREIADDLISMCSVRFIRKINAKIMEIFLLANTPHLIKNYVKPNNISEDFLYRLCCDNSMQSVRWLLGYKPELLGSPTTFLCACALTTNLDTLKWAIHYLTSNNICSPKQVAEFTCTGQIKFLKNILFERSTWQRIGRGIDYVQDDVTIFSHMCNNGYIGIAEFLLELYSEHSIIPQINMLVFKGLIVYRRSDAIEWLRLNIKKGTIAQVGTNYTLDRLALECITYFIGSDDLEGVVFANKYRKDKNPQELFNCTVDELRSIYNSRSYSAPKTNVLMWFLDQIINSSPSVDNLSQIYPELGWAFSYIIAQGYISDVLELLEKWLPRNRWHIPNGPFCQIINKAIHKTKNKETAVEILNLSCDYITYPEINKDIGYYCTMSAHIERNEAKMYVNSLLVHNHPVFYLVDMPVESIEIANAMYSKNIRWIKSSSEKDEKTIYIGAHDRQKTSELLIMPRAIKPILAELERAKYMAGLTEESAEYAAKLKKIEEEILNYIRLCTSPYDL